MRRCVLLLGIILLGAFGAEPREVGAAQEVVTLETRAGVTLKLLLITPDERTKGGFILFPGGDGKGHFGEKGGKIRLSRNFLVRSSGLFVQKGFVAAIVDVPSDQSRGMSYAFRASDEHFEDIKRVIGFLESKGVKPIFLVGTSLGTVSAASFGAAVSDPRIAGIILTASLSLLNLEAEKIKVPVLLVHHRDDWCKASPFEDALRLYRRMSQSPRVDFVEVLGGKPPESQPCEAMSAHGFLGKEREVVQVITDWVSRKAVPSKIGP